MTSEFTYLSAAEEAVLKKVRERPGELVEYAKLQQTPTLRKYTPKSVHVYLSKLVEKGYISKTRRGRKVYFIADDEATKGGSKDSQVKFVVTYIKDEDGYIVASVPALPGCHSQGRTKEEARKNIREALRGYIASMKYHGEPLPQVEVEQVAVAV